MIQLEKLDIDALYEESEKRGIEGICPMCEDEDDHILCYVCGVCFKYCHNDYAHEESRLGYPCDVEEE